MVQGQTKILSVNESKAWQKKLANETIGAKPLLFSRAQEAVAPFQIAVTNGQSPEGKTLIIQLTKRPDVNSVRAIEIVQHALVDVFGRSAGAEAECDYRDIKELRKRMGNEMVSEDHDAITVIFRAGPIAFTRKPDWVRSEMFTAIRHWYDASSNW